MKHYLIIARVNGVDTEYNCWDTSRFLATTRLLIELGSGATIISCAQQP